MDNLNNQKNIKSILSLIGRTDTLFSDDLKAVKQQLDDSVSSSRFLVLGAAGSIGQAVAKEIFKRNPKKLHLVDISENNMVELVRDIRSSYGYITGDFQTFALDIGSIEYDAFIEADGHYDYILNLSALKHVRSEKDPYTLMRMLEVNVFNTEKTIKQAIAKGVKKYFCVSTDKATNPVNMMGASKRIMEMYLQRYSQHIKISTARFANVAFSDGSLLHSFHLRMQKQQPIVAPNDVRRYFVTPQESGELCLISCLFGENRDIFFPKLNEALHLITFAEIAEKYVAAQGYKPYLCQNEDEARNLIGTLPILGKWPCLFTPSDTTGEKDFEEFFTEHEVLDLERFTNLGIIKSKEDYDESKLQHFSSEITRLKMARTWCKEDLVKLFNFMLPTFEHKETGKYLDGKM
ncbi:UDP-N-acetylglucosamine 4,6-dehydratase [Rheinheimera tangshanensis]|jgi:FlaA1/EpsC-like NDP-sugar epimerase|uniref:UDP-N-acetylglucosamine 4,6-dehydratase n=1 Tax=Rheinheimera tangshanensis TaxID=400153 RepID=UPI000027BE30|nr:UDP-N-acetylglucosamine 4,6-dehydratase [Rheinheimera tangshanensis]GGM61344.1 UDP-N-acetylglucosamine 4,6-dehydratase [Rheinheimera tangshanensis]